MAGWEGNNWLKALVEPPRAKGYCRECQGRLEAGDRACRRCKRRFDWERPETWLRSRVFLPWQFWFPGLVLAVFSGVTSYALLLYSGADLAAAMFLGVPVSGGAILGYASR